MRFSPEIRLARQLSSHFVLLTALLTFALSLLLTACGGVNASMPSSQPNAPATPTEKSPLSIAPAMINFGTAQLNSKVATNVVSVTNVGPFAETIKSATIFPTSIFSIQGWTGSVTLDPGQTFQLRTIFDPKSVGNYSGTLTLVTMAAAPVEHAMVSVIGGPTGPPQFQSQVSIPVVGAVSTENSGSPLPVVGVSVSPTFRSAPIWPIEAVHVRSDRNVQHRRDVDCGTRVHQLIRPLYGTDPHWSGRRYSLGHQYRLIQRSMLLPR